MSKENAVKKEKTVFAGGQNIAMKVPSNQWDKTVQFYKDVIGLKVIDHEPTTPPSVCFEFGANQLWIDKVDNLSQAEIWLELVVKNTQTAAKFLESAEVVRCDEVEPLPKNFDGFWISNPASIVHLVAKKEDKN